MECDYFNRDARYLIFKALNFSSIISYLQFNYCWTHFTYKNLPWLCLSVRWDFLGINVNIWFICGFYFLFFGMMDSFHWLINLIRCLIVAGAKSRDYEDLLFFLCHFSDQLLPLQNLSILFHDSLCHSFCEHISPFCSFQHTSCFLHLLSSAFFSIVK